MIDSLCVLCSVGHYRGSLGSWPQNSYGIHWWAIIRPHKNLLTGSRSRFGQQILSDSSDDYWKPTTSSCISVLPNSSVTVLNLVFSLCTFYDCCNDSRSVFSIGGTKYPHSNSNSNSNSSNRCRPCYLAWELQRVSASTHVGSSSAVPYVSVGYALTYLYRTPKVVGDRFRCYV